MDIKRKAMLPTTIISMLLIATALPVSADTIDPNTPDGFVQVNRKIQCSMRDEEPVVYTWGGRAYARVPGERDKHVFSLEGMNIRQCVTVDDEKRGTGFRLVSREIMLYLDPKTNEVLRTFENPWTGTSILIIQVPLRTFNGRTAELPSLSLPKFGRPLTGSLAT